MHKISLKDLRLIKPLDLICHQTNHPHPKSHDILQVCPRLHKVLSGKQIILCNGISDMPTSCLLHMLELL